jgi:hypothetical protein
MEGSLRENNYCKIKYMPAKLTIVQCYAPTNVASIEEKEAFYGSLDVNLQHIKQSDIVILMGNLNCEDW